MNSEPSSFAGAPGTPRTPEVTGLTDPTLADRTLTHPALTDPTLADPTLTDSMVVGPAHDGSLPVMPGFREMGLRRQADEQAARMAEDRGRLVRELAGQRQAAGLSQTEVAARMGTSQSAVARLESGTSDVRASTLERYAAAVGGQITWKLDRPKEPKEEVEGTSE
jgi:DNA-binding XRE family transcriptional regulator